MINVVHYYTFDTYLTHAPSFLLLIFYRIPFVVNTTFITLALRWRKSSNTTYNRVQIYTKKSRHIYVTSNEIQRDIGNLRPGREFITLYNH